MKFLKILLVLIFCFTSTTHLLAAPNVIVLDALDERVVISTPVKRIVCISTALNEVLYALGVSDRLVGRDKASDFSSALDNVPIIADSSYRPQIEAILELDPDLIIADTMLSVDNRRKFESFGVPVIVERGSDPDRLFSVIKNLALATSTEKKGEELINFIDKYETIITERVKGVGRGQKPKVYWEWNLPFKTGSKGASVSPRIELTGGINIAQELVSNYPVVSAEYVWEQDPEVIIKMISRGDSDAEIKESYKELVSRLGIKETSAVRNGRVHLISWTIHNGIRSVIGSLCYAKWLHPELFRDIDVDKIHTEILKQFYDDSFMVERIMYP